MNNYEFWEDYLKKIKSEILKLCSKKKKLHIDFHMHSNYSSDGKQTLKQILENTKKLGFDIIAITDHDNLNVYDELYDYVKDGLTNPIVIPGIEFTIDNREYGNQCHMLQLFVNPKDKIIEKDVLINYQASFNRSKIQFKRLQDNLAIKDLIKNKKISISYEKYKSYLIRNNLSPEYDTLCFYLIDTFQERKITTFEVLDLLEKYNEYDCYEDRKNYKEKRYKELREKYQRTDINNYNSRFLLSMLAVREVDDDWWDKPSSGSLSVNSYGQLKVENLNDKYKIFFAHPEEKRLLVVENIIKSKKNIVGLELNKRSKISSVCYLDDLLKKYNLSKVIGSDTHDSSLEFYSDMKFYEIDSEEIKRIIKICYSV